MKLNRVVVTGYGLTSPIGNTLEEFWNSLQTGKIGIGEITKFDHSEFAVHNAAEVQDFPFDKYFVKKDTNRFDNYSLYALYAAQEAVTHANLDVEAIDKDRFGVIVASGIGGIKEIEDQVIRLHEKGPKRFIGIWANVASLTLSDKTAVISDSIIPGARAFTRTLRLATSRATDLVNPIKPALEAA